MASPQRHHFSDSLLQVHFAEPVQYWRGRFSTLCDHLRSEDYSINSPNFAPTATSTSKKPLPTTKIDNSDSFEQDEMRRINLALEELRSCCRTAEALRAFQVFEQEIQAKYAQESAAERQYPFYMHSAESKVRLLAAGFRPKVIGVDKNIAAATMRVINTKPKPVISMARSKTMGDLGQTKKAVTAGADGKEAKVGWRRPSYLKAQVEVLASEMALNTERRGGAMAAAQRNPKRSGFGVGVTGSPRTTGKDKMLPANAKPVGPHSLPRKSSGTGAGAGTNAEMLKRVFSEGVRSVRRMGRSFTRMSGSGEV
jgi:hypothetical protein